MDAKITKKRLSRMLSYDWLKIVGVAVGIIFVWLLIFQMLATRVMPSQRFVVVNYTGNMVLDNEYTAHFSKTAADGVLSGDVIETETLDVTLDSAYSEVFQARVQLNEFDIIFVSQQWDPNSLIENEDENAPAEYAYTYLETYLLSYRYCMYDLDLNAEDGYFAQLEDYLAPYFDEQGELNTAQVEKDFRARVARMKDKRYKNEEQIQEGIKIDIDRIQKYQKALVAFYEYLENGYIQIVQTTHTSTEEYDYDWSGSYAINICPSTIPDTAKNELAKLVRYQTEDDKVSAENMCVSFFRGESDEEPAYRFEGLVYTMNLIENILNA